MNKTQLPLVVFLALSGLVLASSVAAACVFRSNCYSSLLNIDMVVPEEEKAIEPIHQLIRFLSYLSHGNDHEAYGLVAPSSIKNGDPIANRAALDRNSFENEIGLNSNRVKFAKYQLGELRWESPDRLRLFIHFENGDNDESLLVRENDHWRIADPIHIIR